MALVPIKTASETGYCDCVCGYCPACAKAHVEWNTGIGIPQPAPAKVSANEANGAGAKKLPPSADPPARLR